MLTVSRVQANSIGAGGSVCLPGSTKIHEQSLADMQEVRANKVDVFLTTSYNRFCKFNLKSYFLKNYSNVSSFKFLQTTILFDLLHLVRLQLCLQFVTFTETMGFGTAGHGIAFLCDGHVLIHSSAIKVPFVRTGITTADRGHCKAWQCVEARY